MAVPARPTSGAPVATDWGQVAHDTIVAQDLQAGTAAVSIAASTQGSTVVTFPRPFAVAPVVVAMIVSQAGGALNLWCQAATTTPTQVTLRLSAAASTTQSNIGVHWVAYGPRA